MASRDITLRGTKGSALTHAEMDQNFNSLSGVVDNKVAGDSPYTLLLTDQNKTLEINSASAFGLTLPAAAISGLDTDEFMFRVKNIGAGAVTITPDGTEKIDNAATLVLNQDEYVLLQTGSGVAGYEWNVLNKGFESDNRVISGARTFEKGINYITASGTDTYAATLSPALTAYNTGAEYNLTFTNANTSTTPTININTLGAKTIVKEGSNPLAVGDITAGHEGKLRYDGTNMVLLNPAMGVTIQTIYVPAFAIVPRTTSGATLAAVETTTQKIMLKTMDFEADVQRYAQVAIRMPKGWDESTVQARFVWSSVGAGDVIWGIQAVALSNDDVIDGTAFGTAQEPAADTSVVGDVQETEQTAAITIAGTPAEGDWVVFQIYRDPVNVSDTNTSPARLHGVIIEYGTTSLNDA